MSSSKEITVNGEVLIKPPIKFSTGPKQEYSKLSQQPGIRRVFDTEFVTKFGERAKIREVWEACGLELWERSFHGSVGTGLGRGQQVQRDKEIFM